MMVSNVTELPSGSMVVVLEDVEAGTRNEAVSVVAESCFCSGRWLLLLAGVVKLFPCVVLPPDGTPALTLPAVVFLISFIGVNGSTGGESIPEPVPPPPVVSTFKCSPPVPPFADVSILAAASAA